MSNWLKIQNCGNFKVLHGYLVLIVSKMQDGHIPALLTALLALAVSGKVTWAPERNPSVLMPGVEDE